MSTVVSKINCAAQDYDTLALWEDAKDGDLVTATTIQQADVYDDDGVLTCNDLTIDGSTTSADYYMKISSPSGERHSGTYGGATLQITVWGNGHHCINLADNYSVVEWLSIYHNKEYGASLVLVSAENCTVHHNIAKSSDTSLCTFITVAAAGVSAVIHNNIAYDMGAGMYITQGCGTVKIYNNTFYNIATDGIYIFGATNVTVDLRNTILVGCGDDWDNGYGAATTGSDNNLTEDGDAPDDIQTTQNLTTEFFVSSTDLHLRSTADAVNAGADLGATYATDIDGATRSGTWDIGADEYVASTTYLSNVRFYEGN